MLQDFRFPQNKRYFDKLTAGIEKDPNVSVNGLCVSPIGRNNGLLTLTVNTVVVTCL